MAYIEINLDQFEDQDLIEELEARDYKVSREMEVEERELFTRIWLADREGRKDEAYALMREYVFEKLGKVI